MTHVAVLPGDGIGPEVTEQALRVLDALGIDHAEHPFGGNAILAGGTPLPDETLAACRAADGILLGAVGLPVSAGLANGAFKSSAVCCGAEMGLLASLVLSTLPSPTSPLVTTCGSSPSSM